MCNIVCSTWMMGVVLVSELSDWRDKGDMLYNITNL